MCVLVSGIFADESYFLLFFSSHPFRIALFASGGNKIYNYNDDPAEGRLARGYVIKRKDMGEVE